MGDALGVPMIGRRPATADFPTLDTTPRDMTGGGPFELLPGQCSSPTQLAVMTWKHLQRDGKFDFLEYARDLVQWSQATAGADALEHLRLACARLAEGSPPEGVGESLWLEALRPEGSAVPLAQVVPLAVHFPAREARFDATVAAVQLTDFAPESVVGAALLNGVIAGAIASPAERIDTKALAVVAENELSYAAATLGKRHPDWVSDIKKAADGLRADLRAAQHADPQMYGPEVFIHGPQGGTARVAIRLALWEVFHAPSFEAAVLDVANRGGESNLTGAITGAVFGAIWGEAAIPTEWRERMLFASEPDAAWLAFHPRQFIPPS
ncbi:MAG: ADP-ribosylglycohydrolase family protein [Archangium sp.]|nr:ADP-ribosylglycohydrolase family protein [Archangium sp.]